MHKTQNLSINIVGHRVGRKVEVALSVFFLVEFNQVCKPIKVAISLTAGAVGFLLLVSAKKMGAFVLYLVFYIFEGFSILVWVLPVVSCRVLVLIVGGKLYVVACCQ
jgi:hypothetical protein